MARWRVVVLMALAVSCQWTGSFEGTQCDGDGTCGGSGSGFVCVAKVCRPEGFDAGAIDAGAIDAGTVDAGPGDAGGLDGGGPDAGPVDAGPVDAGQLDAGPCLLLLIGDVGVKAPASSTVLEWDNQCPGATRHAVLNALNLSDAGSLPVMVDGGVFFPEGVAGSAASLDVTMPGLPSSLTLYVVGRSGRFLPDSGATNTDLIAVEVRQPGSVGALGSFWNLFVGETSSGTVLALGKSVGSGWVASAGTPPGTLNSMVDNPIVVGAVLDTNATVAVQTAAQLMTAGGAMTLVEDGGVISIGGPGYSGYCQAGRNCGWRGTINEVRLYGVPHDAVTRTAIMAELTARWHVQ